MFTLTNDSLYKCLEMMKRCTNVFYSAYHFNTLNIFWKDNLQGSNWEWVSASIQQTSSQANSDTVKIIVNDADSEFNGQHILIPSNKIDDENILMANTWTSDSMVSQESYGTGFDEHGNVTTHAKTKKPSWRQKSNWRDNKNKVQPEDPSVDNILPPNDLIHLTHLHEPAVVYSLKKRYNVDEIYTSTGPILIALNPFKKCSVLYSHNVMQMYLERGERLSGKTSSRNGSTSHIKPEMKLPPHIYAIADDAYRNMMRTLSDRREMRSVKESADQSILVSGESGAGKTVTTKIIMKYLATLSKRSMSPAVVQSLDKFFVSDKGSNVSERTIEQQLLQSNPILESFGNARTIRNDNSSRFGKYIEIQFSEAGHLCGASIDTYLLEKVRLINQAPGERNYHIFYEILAGASIQERKQFFLGTHNAADFSMTSKSGVYDRRDGVRDDNTYAEFKEAMQIIGFSPEDQHYAVSVACVVLHLSNTTFVEISDLECELDIQNESLSAALALMGVSAEALNDALCRCRIEAGGEIVFKTLSVEKSRKALEAMIKAIYSALFTHIVNTVNTCITGVDSSKKAALIGVLDIFGFETFETNSFEQLCINYCNEALQQQFNRFIFKIEQEEYKNEGISWSFISFPDNQDVIDLIEKKHSGVLSILDEQCLLGSCTDQSFALATYDKCKAQGRFSADRKQRANGCFSIEHYAGHVEYDTKLFLEKNKDELPKEATELLFSSSIPFLQYLASILDNPSKRSNPSELSPTSVRSYGRKKSSLVRVSVGGQFRSQLRKLRDRINVTVPHYVRCLKPNDFLKPNQFDPAVIADQLRCGGILEAIRVSRIGFPQRYAHDRFAHRYGILARKDLAFSRGSSLYSNKSSCEIIFDSIARQIIDRKQSKSKSMPQSLDKENRGFPEEKKSIEFPYKPSYGNQLRGRINSSFHVKQKKTNYLEAGMQMGKSKVFLRRWAFDMIEELLGDKKASAATLINSIVRMYLGRCHFLRLVEEYYINHWEDFTAEEQYEIAAQRGYVLEQSQSQPPERMQTYCIVEKFEGLKTSEPIKREISFKWRLIDGRWIKN